MPTTADLEAVSEFRNRLVGHADYVISNVPSGALARYASTQAGPEVLSHIGAEQAWLNQEYGRIHRVVSPYGTAAMQQFGRIVSQDVILDAIGSPDHPGYNDLAQMAVQHLDRIIGRMRADVDDTTSTARATTVDRHVLYRATSPLYWMALLVRAVGRLLSTTRGRVAAIVGAIGLTIIGAVVSGAAQAWVARVLEGGPVLP